MTSLALAIPHQGTPTATAVHRLQTKLYERGIYPSITYEDGQPQLHVFALTVWIDPKATTFFWSSCSGERAARGPANDPVMAARRIADRLRPPIIAGPPVLPTQ
ncbi:hypothetical protein OG339_45605 [Streptosporangium sp. NBC_01495]|uniref:hypothetical protein n=1 Tax=Streptosporangium sp. NBC_01495 TaxID=2903899 RepID=UPI002E345737|nr:hypothetical protein [Streptosporangium sp. NBC_01495]